MCLFAFGKLFCDLFLFKIVSGGTVVSLRKTGRCAARRRDREKKEREGEKITRA